MPEENLKRELLQDAGGVLVAGILPVMAASGVHVTITMVDTCIACGVKYKRQFCQKRSKATQW